MAGRAEVLARQVVGGWCTEGYGSTVRERAIILRAPLHPSSLMEREGAPSACRSSPTYPAAHQPYSPGTARELARRWSSVEHAVTVAEERHRCGARRGREMCKMGAKPGRHRAARRPRRLGVGATWRHRLRLGASWVCCWPRRDAAEYRDAGVEPRWTINAPTLRKRHRGGGRVIRRRRGRVCHAEVLWAAPHRLAVEGAQPVVRFGGAWPVPSPRPATVGRSSERAFSVSEWPRASGGGRRYRGSLHRPYRRYQ